MCFIGRVKRFGVFSVDGGYEVGMFLKEASNCIVQGCTFKNLTENFSEAQPAPGKQ